MQFKGNYKGSVSSKSRVSVCPGCLNRGSTVALYSAQAVDLRPVLGTSFLALTVKCLVRLRARGLLKGKYKAKVRHPEKGDPPIDAKLSR